MESKKEILKNFRIAFLTNANYPINDKCKEWNWQLFVVSRTSKMEIKCKNFDVVILDGGNCLNETEHKYYGDELSEFVDNGGCVILLGWSFYTDALYGFGGKFYDYFPMILKSDNGSNFKETFNQSEKESLEKIVSTS